MTHAADDWFAVDPWAVVERRLDPQRYRRAEGTLALANGYLGSRASFEEGLGGAESLRGTYVAGVFDHYPNPTMIRLKGRPANPSEMVNVPDILPVSIHLDGERLDLAACRVERYRRALLLDQGVLQREVEIADGDGRRARIVWERFLSKPRPHLAALRVGVTPLGWEGEVAFTAGIDGNVGNLRHRHLGEPRFHRDEPQGTHGLACATPGTAVAIAALASDRLQAARPGRDELSQLPAERASRHLLAARAADGETVVLEKICAVATSRDPAIRTDPLVAAQGILSEAAAAGYDALRAEHAAWWRRFWAATDVEIEESGGGGRLTQGLRYCLFQMAQNAPERDPSVNIGAKGLTGEHYFGTYFWDTEAFMLPFFAFVRPDVAKHLVGFRARTLPGAREKAAEMDLPGAAFPFMADAEGRESCTLWQFALLGIHVTAAVAWGVWFTWETTGDDAVLLDGGLEILVETARFWRGRAHRTEAGAYVINRVLGPDEYHQGVDNNFYTNLMARHNLRLPARAAEVLRAQHPDAWEEACRRLALDAEELAGFEAVADGLRLPRDEARGISLQDDRFLDLEPHDLRAEPPGGPLNAVWSYDRIMRTRLLRQGDVLVGHLLLGEDFPDGQLARDFDFYEPITTHDSSLSFCHHSILAAALGRDDLAEEYFLRTARLDLDDLHGNAWQGVHTACLAGAWQCVVFGFGGVRWHAGTLRLEPRLPPGWTGCRFTLCWRGARLRVSVREDTVTVERLDDGAEPLPLLLYGRKHRCGADPLRVPRPS